MPGRAEELYKMHLIIAPCWMKEINGFPFSEPTALANVSFFFPLLKTSICCYRITSLRHPPHPSRLPFPVTPSWTHPSAVPVMRATPEFMITSRQWKVICQFTARWTPFDTAIAISHFLRVKSFPRARARPPPRNILPLYLTCVVENCVFCRVRQTFGSRWNYYTMKITGYS